MAESICLYDQDAYRTEFEATVLACEKVGEQYAIELDQTCFFPEQGGQTPDYGNLYPLCEAGDYECATTSEKQSVAVKDVQIQDGCILHTCDKAIPVGAKVRGEIDWKHRFDNMQQHSGEHIFSGLVHSHFGYDNVGFHLSDHEVIMDFNGILTDIDIAMLEAKANEIIAQNLPIQVTYPSDAELEALPYRSKKELTGRIRIVTIPGVDICACCAPHVRTTAEIGLLKVDSLQKYKGGVRVTILCGLRAVFVFRAEHVILQRLSRSFSTGFDNVEDAVEKLREENNSYKEKYLQARESLLTKEIEEIPAEQEHVLLYLEEEANQKLMQNALNILKQKHAGALLVLSGSEEKGYRYLAGFGTAEADARNLQAGLKEHLNARGGGSAQMVQGSIQDKTKGDIETCFESLQNAAK